jgi:integrase
MSKRLYGTVDRLASGRWRARYRGPDGRRRSAPLTFSTKADAARWLARTETDISRGVWTDPASGDVTLRTYADAWLPQRTVKGAPLAARTLGTYRHSLDAWILPRLGEHKLKTLTPAVVRTWHSWLLSQTGPTAARQAYALLRAILNTAVADDAIPRNPCRVAGAGQPRSPERPLLDLETVEALIAAMPPHLRPLVTVTFWASLRLGEAIALERRDVDLKSGTLRIERQRVEHENRSIEAPPKAASRRTVHLPDQALTVLRHWLEARPGLPTAPLFTQLTGERLRHRHVQTAWTTARAKVPGAERAHLHDLRHASLTLTAQLGATQAERMRRAGHASTRAAAIYQHAAASRDRDLAALLSRLGEGGQGDRRPRVR